jgi:hypothetical protein
MAIPKQTPSTHPSLKMGWEKSKILTNLIFSHRPGVIGDLLEGVLRVSVDLTMASLLLERPSFSPPMDRNVSFRKCVFAIAFRWVLPRESVNRRKRA